MGFFLGALIKKFATGDESARMVAGMSITAAFGQRAIQKLIAALEIYPDAIPELLVLLGGCCDSASAAKRATVRMVGNKYAASADPELQEAGEVLIRHLDLLDSEDE